MPIADHPTEPLKPVHRLVAIARNGQSVVAISRCAHLSLFDA